MVFKMKKDVKFNKELEKKQIKIFCEPYKTYDASFLNSHFLNNRSLDYYRKYPTAIIQQILKPYKLANVVILAAGPSGGLISDFLLTDRIIDLLISDIDLGVVLGWKKYLGNRYQGEKKIEFAVINARMLPFENESVDVVALYDAFGNLSCCETQDVLQESYRILRKGGKLVTDYSYIVALDLNVMPKLRAFKGYRRIYTDEYNKVGYTEVNTIFGGVKKYPDTQEMSSLSECCTIYYYQIAMRRICQIAVK